MEYFFTAAGETWFYNAAGLPQIASNRMVTSMHTVEMDRALHAQRINWEREYNCLREEFDARTSERNKLLTENAILELTQEKPKDENHGKVTMDDMAKSNSFFKDSENPTRFLLPETVQNDLSARVDALTKERDSFMSMYNSSQDRFQEYVEQVMKSDSKAGDAMDEALERINILEGRVRAAHKAMKIKMKRAKHRKIATDLQIEAYENKDYRRDAVMNSLISGVDAQELYEIADAKTKRLLKPGSANIMSVLRRRAADLLKGQSNV